MVKLTVEEMEKKLQNYLLGFEKILDPAIDFGSDYYATGGLGEKTFNLAAKYHEILTNGKIKRPF